MNALRPYIVFSFAFFFASCASLQLGTEFLSGRRALLQGDTETALAYFQSVAQKDPEYTYGNTYRQGILSYLGRTQYLTGKLPQAQQTLQKALARNHTEDHLARLYLGMTLARSGDRAQGLKQIEASMEELHAWFDYIEYNTLYGEFWDPGKKMRAELETNLAMIRGKDLEWQKVIANGEWLGKRMEEEIDQARWDRTRDLLRDGDDDDGDSQP